MKVKRHNGQVIISTPTQTVRFCENGLILWESQKLRGTKQPLARVIPSDGILCCLPTGEQLWRSDNRIRVFDQGCWYEATVHCLHTRDLRIGWNRNILSINWQLRSISQYRPNLPDEPIIRHARMDYYGYWNSPKDLSNPIPSRKEGAAIIHLSEDRKYRKGEWFVRGIRHRSGGPAIEDPQQGNRYFLNGEEILPHIYLAHHLNNAAEALRYV